MRAGTWVLIVALAMIAASTLIWFGQRRLIYFPFAHVPSPGSLGLARAELVAFTTEDRLTLHGWFVPAAGDPTGVTFVVFNGNGGNRAHRAPLAAALADRGVATLLFDYRGYGDNPGSPSESGLARDAGAAWRYAAGRPDVDPKRIVFFGESLGTGVATALSLEHPPAALILRSPFTSIPDIGQHHYPFLPVRLIARDRFPTIDRVARVTCPVLVIAGSGDRLIPLSYSKQVFDAAPEPKRLVVIDADHNDYDLLSGERLISAVVAFVTPALR